MNVHAVGTTDLHCKPLRAHLRHPQSTEQNVSLAELSMALTFGRTGGRVVVNGKSIIIGAAREVSRFRLFLPYELPHYLLYVRRFLVLP